MIEYSEPECCVLRHRFKHRSIEDGRLLAIQPSAMLAIEHKERSDRRKRDEGISAKGKSICLLIILT
jgi:hypothetical protein